MALRIRRGHKRSPSAPQVSHSPSSSISSSSSTPTAQIHEATRAHAGPTPRRVAIVGTGREALALSPRSADAFAQSLNLSMAVCSSPEVNVHFPTDLKPIPNPGPVRELRRIASEAGFAPRPQSMRIPPTPPQSTVPKGLPPPPRPQRRRPPPVLVSKLGAPIAQAEQSDSPFTATTPRASSVPPSASSSFWGCAGPQTAKSLRTSRSCASRVGSVSTVASTSAGSDSELDLDGLDIDDYDFSSTEDEDIKSPLGGTYFPPPPARRSRATGPRPLRVQVSIEQVAFRDGSPVVRHSPPRWESEDEDEPRAGVAYAGWEDGIKSRPQLVEDTQPRPKRSIGKALGRWLKKHT